MSTPPHSVLVTQNNVIPRLCGEFLVGWFTSLSLSLLLIYATVSYHLSSLPCAVVNLAHESHFIHKLLHSLTLYSFF